MNLWSLRKLGRFAALRGAARRLVNLYYRHGTVRTIPTGPLAGMRWCCSRHQILWMPLGLYEPETANYLGSTLSEGMTFFDVGAHVGYFTLLASRLVGEAGHVVAFEPHPENARVLERQIILNTVKNATIERVALARESGNVGFTLEMETANSHLGQVTLAHAATKPVEIVTVTALTLDDFVAQRGLDPSVIKIDVEGAETMVLEGGARTFATIRPTCLVSTHSGVLRSQCRKLLEARGYRVAELSGFAHELIGVPE